MMKLISQIIGTILLTGFLSSCDVECHVQQYAVFRGEIPDSVINLVPYENGNAVKFINSEGKILTYQIVRESTQTTDQTVSECYVTSISYEEDETNLIADSTEDQIIFWITNQVEFTFYDATINGEHFAIPASFYQYQLADRADTMTINNVVYYDVLKQTSISKFSQDHVMTTGDTLYYNYEFGILEVVFEDGSWFQRIPE